MRSCVSALAISGICSSAAAHVLPARAPPPPPPPGYNQPPPSPPADGPGKPGAALPVSHRSTCSGQAYINRGLVAFGTVASNARDQYGDTLGGFGSAISADPSSFRATSNGSISGTLFTAGDRGWNTEGSIDYQTRIHRNTLRFTPTFGQVGNGTQNLHLEYLKSTLISKGNVPATGLDADYVIAASGGFPDLPAGKRANDQLSPAIDLEGMVWLRDGSFYISEEYGPYIYHIGKDGQILQAIRPPISFIPFTDGEESFTSGNPPVGSDIEEADDPDTGRANNHGFEGLALSPDERQLTVQIQASLMEDGGDHGTRANNTRQLVYDISNKADPKLIHEWVLQQPAVNDPSEDKDPRALDVSELHYLSRTQYFVLTRDGGHGRGSGSDTPSTYRHIDIVSTSSSDDLAKQELAGPGTVAIAPNGYLLPDVDTEDYCSFIDINNNTDLARFGLHNGGPQAGELNEKWESLAVIPVPAGAAGHGPNEYYIVSVSDNDFITQDGYYNFGKTQYSDASGENVSTQILVWQAYLPNYGQ